MIDPIIVAGCSVSLTALVAAIVHRYLAKGFYERSNEQLERISEAERALHAAELRHQSELNQLTIEKLDEVKEARQLAIEEGRVQGRNENEVQSSLRLLEREKAHQSEIHVAVSEALERQRIEQQNQIKIFSIEVSPYVLVTKDGGFFSSEHVVKRGYQYQLFVNGIPTFQPHIHVQREERHSQFDETVKLAALAAVESLVQAAVLAVGGAPIRIGEAIIKS